MRVIMLTWEYPPKIVGGISPHVYGLAHGLVAQGVEVHVITCEHPGAAAEEVEDGIHIYRVTPSGPGNDFIHWVQLLNDAMLARADALIPELLAKDTASPLLLHAHDWLTHYASAALKHKYHLPLVATIHATEYGRNSGIKGPTQEYINSVEWNLQNEAWRVIVCTEFMKRECEHALLTPWDKDGRGSERRGCRPSSICPNSRPKSAPRFAPSTPRRKKKSFSLWAAWCAKRAFRC